MRKNQDIGTEQSVWIPDSSTVVRVDAYYRRAQAVEHRGNPCIEALPPYLQSDEPLQYFANYPKWSSDECHATAAQRVTAIRRIRTYHETLPWHKMVMNDIFRAIWGAYEHWNPLVNRAAEVQRLYEEIQTGRSTAHPLRPMEPVHASMIGLLGGSGLGKSTAVRRALSFLPQVINHPEHGFRQLVWVHIQCPPNGDLNTLLLYLVRHIDNLMGTTHFKMLTPRSSFGNRTEEVFNLFEMFRVAILVLDEAHNIFLKNTRIAYLNFITSVCNLKHTAVMHVGLPSALEAFFRNLYTARRTTDGGLRELEPRMSKQDWQTYLNGLMKYQWTTERASVNEIGPALEHLSARIPALSSRLFELAQIRVVSSRAKKKVTTEVLSDVARNYFGPVQECLVSLREAENAKIPGFEEALKKAISGLEGEIDKRTESVQEAVTIKEARNQWLPIVRKAAQQLADSGEEASILVPKLVGLIQSKKSMRPTVDGLIDLYFQHCSAESHAPETAPKRASQAEHKAATKMHEERDSLRQRMAARVADTKRP